MNNIIKRYFSLILVLVIFFTLLVSPVSASSFDPVTPNTIDLFDFQSFDERTFTTDSNSLSVSFTLPNSFSYFGYVEFLVRSNKDIQSISIAGDSVPFTNYGNVYRFYNTGNFSAGSSLNITFTFNSSSAFVYFSSAEAMFGYPINNFVGSSVTSYVGSEANNFTYVDQPINISSFYVENYQPAGTYRYSVRFVFDDVKLYDFLTLSLYLDASNITSVTAGIADTLNIPYSLTYLDTIDSLETIYSKITIDLRDVNWNGAKGPLTLSISGDVYYDGSINDTFFSINGIHGFTLSNNPNPIIFWFRKTFFSLSSWFNTLSNQIHDIFTGRDQDQAGADSFNDSINDQADELEDLTSDLNSVTRPPLSDVNLSTSGMVNQSAVLLATNGIGSILSNQIILRVLIMSLTFALAGFILFGKR